MPISPITGLPIITSFSSQQRVPSNVTLVTKALDERDQNRFSSPLFKSKGVAAILAEQKFKNQQIQLFRLAALRIREIAAGDTPNPDFEWEKLGGYFAANGIPFGLDVVDVKSGNNQSGLEVQVSDLTDQRQLSRYSLTDRRRFSEAFQQVQDAVQYSQVRSVYESDVLQLDRASGIVSALETFYPAGEIWEFEYNTARRTGYPVELGINENGEVEVRSQSEYNRRLDAEEASAIFIAARRVRQVVDNIALLDPNSQLELDALSYANSQKGYSLHYDRVTRQVEVLPINGRSRSTSYGADGVRDRGQFNSVVVYQNRNFIPLQEYKQPFINEAVQLYKEKKSYTLELKNGTFSVREHSFVNFIQRLSRPDVLTPEGRLRFLSDSSAYRNVFV